MDLFAMNSQIDALELQLTRLHGHARLPTLIELAWYQRQSNTERAIEYVNEAEQLLTGEDKNSAENASFEARLNLVRGEAMLLYGDRASAVELANRAKQTFESGADSIGLGDCYWLLASINLDRGDYESIDSDLARALDSYKGAADALRADMAEMRRLYYAASIDPDKARAVVSEHRLFQSQQESDHSLTTWTESINAYLSLNGGDVILHWQKVFEAALTSGQLRQAIVATANMAEEFIDLHDSNSALDVAERGLELARNADWPAVIGLCLVQTGDVFRSLERYQDAQDILEEALPKLTVESQAYANAVLNLGKLALEVRDYETAEQRFTQAGQCFQELFSFDGRVRSQLGRAQALMALGHHEQVHALLDDVSQQAERYGMNDVNVEVHRVMAKLAGVESYANRLEHQPLYFLKQALAQAKSIDNFVVPASLLDDLAAEYADQEDYRNAYQCSVEAGLARQRAHAQDRNLRDVSMHMKKDSERLISDSKFHKHLLEVEAKRADELMSANSTLELLGTIGQEITASLNINDVFSSLVKHLHSLLDAASIIVYQMSPDNTHLSLAFGIEESRPIPFHQIALDDNDSKIAFCARERQMLMLSVKDRVVLTTPGTLFPLSRMYSPLMIGSKLLGVMSIQSFKPYAYSKREQLIFRTLCAYLANAISNCNALADLHQAQAELIEKNIEFEKLAMVDGLTGLFNRRYLDWSMQQHLAASDRYGNNMSIILLDIDHFKHVNDNYGHQIGDVVLCNIGQILQSRSRESDIPGRWGGEEFLIVCPNCNLRAATMFAEKLRQLIAQFTFPHVGTCTASLGVAEYRKGDNESTLIERVDRSLYAAKAQGRNQVVALD